MGRTSAAPRWALTTEHGICMNLFLIYFSTLVYYGVWSRTLTERGSCYYSTMLLLFDYHCVCFV